MNLIECRDVNKSYSGRKVLKKVNLSIESGKIYGLLGRNGAGKTTLLNLISNRLTLNKGEIRLFEREISSDSLKKICYVSDYMPGFEGMKVRDIYKRASRIYPKWDKRYAKDLLDRFHLGKNYVYGRVSKGQTTCIGLILAMASGCEMIILDEIYSGLDAIVRKDLYDLILDDYERTKRTFLLSSHLIQEMDTLFTDIIIMKNGEILMNDSYENVVEQTYIITGRPEITDLIPDSLILDQENLQNMVRLTAFGRKTEKYFDKLSEQGANITHASLQDIFVSMLAEEE